MWECVDTHGNVFTKEGLSAIGQHVVAFWPLDVRSKSNAKQQPETLAPAIPTPIANLPAGSGAGSVDDSG